MSKRSAQPWQKFTPEDDGGFNLETFQDTTPVIEGNKTDYNKYGDLRTQDKQGDGVRVASIPITVWEKWMKETNGMIQKQTNLVKKYLNDHDNKYIRNTTTRV